MLLAVLWLVLIGGSAPAGASKPTTADDEDRPPHVTHSPILLGVISGIAVEVAIPDVRYEWVDEGDNGWTLSWPVHLVQHRIGRTHLSLFGEPQLRVTGDNQLRVLGGIRMTTIPLAGVPFGLLVEVGGLWGEDGNGGFVGGGIAWDMVDAASEDDSFPALPTLSLVYRQVFTGGIDRGDLALDMMLFGIDLPLRGM